MEHSLLHGLQICGLIFAAGGVLFHQFILWPVLRAASAFGQPEAELLIREVSRWTALAAAAGALASTADLFVQCAELKGETIFAGVDFRVMREYLFETEVGRIALVKAALLGIAAVVSRMKKSAPILLAILAGAVIASTLVSHSAALPRQRELAIAAQILHLLGAAVWLGMLFFLALTALIEVRRIGPSELLPKLLARFSPFAAVSFFFITASGLYSLWRFIESPGSLLVSAYGLTLILKMVLLSLVMAAGYYNWRVLRPQIAENRTEAGQKGPQYRFLWLLEFELSAGIVLLLVAGILGAISPPSAPGVGQLSAAQTSALLTPRLPPGRLADPAKFVGAINRTDDDLRYAEFTHQWSGVFVALLGSCWLAQSMKGRAARISARIWPLLLVLFGCFIAIIADPEIWILRTYSLGQVLANPQVLEHQIGAVLVFGLAALGLRDRTRPAEARPLGKAFPILVILGSLMLLGHAHSNLGVSEELSSLINMEHALIGGLGLIAGLARWFQLRQLPGENVWRYLWPGAIVAVGVFMAFFYRELPLPSACIDARDYSMISRLR